MTFSNDNPVRLVKELKGAALSVLIVLQLSGQPVNNDWIERNTGYSDKPVAKALAYLHEHQFVIKTAQGWKLSDGAIQLPLPFDQIAEDREAQTEQDKSDTDGRSRNNSDSSINTKDLNKIKDSLSINTKPSRRISDSAEPEGGKNAVDGDEIQAVASALRDCGIRVNRRTRPLLTKITAREVREAYRKLDYQGKAGETGLFVTILEDVAEKKLISEHEENQKYASWNE